MKAHEMVAKVRTLPSISPAALKLVGLLAEANAGNEDVVATLRQDTVLTAKLLRACNSPALGLKEPVASVDQAVLLLGYDQMHRTATALAMSGAMSVRLPGYDAQVGLWRHSLFAAAAAEAIINHGADLTDAATAYTAGLLHDIGKLIVCQFLTEELRATLHRLVVEGFTTDEAERKLFGTDHAEAGSCLLYLWRLPAQIIEAVANHHQPALDPHPRFSAVAHVANCIAHLAEGGAGSETYALPADAHVLAGLDLDAEKFANLTNEVRAVPNA